MALAGVDKGPYPFRGCAQRIIEQMRVARRCRRLGVAEQLADNRKRQASARQDRCLAPSRW